MSADTRSAETVLITLAHHWIFQNIHADWTVEVLIDIVLESFIHVAKITRRHCFVSNAALNAIQQASKNSRPWEEKSSHVPRNKVDGFFIKILEKQHIM